MAEVTSIAVYLAKNAFKLHESLQTTPGTRPIRALAIETSAPPEGSVPTWPGFRRLARTGAATSAHP